MATLDAIALLQPTTQTGSIAGQNNQTVSPLEAAGRVMPRFIKEASEKLKWNQVTWIPYDTVLKAQQEAMGELFVANEPPKVRHCLAIGKALGARYVVTYAIRELTGYRASGLVARKGGRASISLMVFDTESKRYVWQSENTETSIREAWLGNESLSKMMDQALFNAIRKALEKFVKGERMEVKTSSVQLVAKVVAMVADKKVLLDLGQDKGLRVGDILVSFDGKTKLKVTEVLDNGTVAEVVEGEAKEGLVVKSTDE